MGIRAFLWGCALGVILGLLSAPKRGEETRADVQRWWHEWQTPTQEQVAEVRDAAATATRQGLQGVNTALDQAQQTTNRVANRAKEQVNRTSQVQLGCSPGVRGSF